MDTNILMIIGIVAVVAVVLYAVERYTQKKPVEWMDASKIGLLSGAGAGRVHRGVPGDECAAGHLRARSGCVCAAARGG